MAIGLTFINLIIPIENIEKKYPGGFKQYKRENQHIRFDNFLVMKGAMSAYDIESYEKECEAFGLVGVVEKNGKEHWQDFCVVEGEPTLPCEWIRVNGHFASHKNDKVQEMINTFSPTKWIKQFKTASQKRAGFREMRAEIFQQTVKAIQQGQYASEQCLIKLDTVLTARETHFYKKPQPLKPIESDFETNFNVINADCIETAGLLKKAGYNVCMLNLASRQNPGGGVLNGAGAQEENIFRRSNLFQSLYQFVDYSYQYDVERNYDNSYPLERQSGGIYSKNITIIRGSENNGYNFLQTPFDISIVSVPAINEPKLETFQGNYRIVDDLVGPTEEKIRTILRICGEHNHDCLVLGAFGCGAYKNPPAHIAHLFKRIFREEEFENRFKLVVFAILDDQNSWQEHNPEGNVMPFVRVFENKFKSYY